MKNVHAIAMATLVCGLLATPASADITAFTGANMTPANRQVRGVAVSVGLIVVAFEFEYADTTDDPTALAPALKTGSGNVLLQTPGALFGFQPYFTTGGGSYRYTLARIRIQVSFQHRRRRESVAYRPAATAGGLSGVQIGERCAQLSSAPGLCRPQSEILNCRIAELQHGLQEVKTGLGPSCTASCNVHAEARRR